LSDEVGDDDGGDFGEDGIWGVSFGYVLPGGGLGDSKAEERPRR